MLTVPYRLTGGPYDGRVGSCPGNVHLPTLVMPGTLEPMTVKESLECEHFSMVKRTKMVVYEYVGNDQYRFLGERN